VGPERRDENKSEASALEEPTESTAEKAKSNEPSNYKWLFAYFQRDYTGAIALLEEQIALQPEGDERIDLESWRGRAQYRVDPTAGTTSLETLIAKHPSRPEPYFHLAFAHRDRDLPEDALRAFDRGLTAASGRHELVSGKVSLLCDLGRDENAIALLREGISDNSTHAPYYHQLAGILKAKNQGAEALRVVEEGLEAAPENEDLLSFYATELFEGPDKKLALVPYNRLVALQPSNPSYLTLRGNLYLDLELHDSAMCAYKQANELAQGKQGWILANIGNLYKNRGFFTDGIDYLKKALVIAPNDDYAHQRLGLSLELLRKEQEQLQSLVKEARQILAAQRATRKTAGA
jgi:tetratricopeptide (TPR) repeat protein